MFNKPDGAGKGDAPRPTDWEKFSSNFDKIFGTKDDASRTTTREETTGEGKTGEGKE